MRYLFATLARRLRRCPAPVDAPADTLDEPLPLPPLWFMLCDIYRMDLEHLLDAPEPDREAVTACLRAWLEAVTAAPPPHPAILEAWRTHRAATRSDGTNDIAERKPSEEETR